MFHERTNKVKLCTKVLFRKLSLKDNLHNTRKTTEKIAGGFLAFAEHKRTIGLIYLLKIPIFRGMPKAKFLRLPIYFRKKETCYLQKIHRLINIKLNLGANQCPL